MLNAHLFVQHMQEGLEDHQQLAQWKQQKAPLSDLNYWYPEWLTYLASCIADPHFAQVRLDACAVHVLCMHVCTTANCTLYTYVYVLYVHLQHTCICCAYVHNVYMASNTPHHTQPPASSKG